MPYSQNFQLCVLDKIYLYHNTSLKLYSKNNIIEHSSFIYLCAYVHVGNMHKHALVWLWSAHGD